MAWDPNFPHEDIPEGYFQAGMHLQRTPDARPDLWELLNALRSADGVVKRGVATVTAGGTTKAVTFTTAFPVGTTVEVVLTSQAGNVVCFASAKSVNGFTANQSGVLGADNDIAWIAYPAP